MIEEFQKLLQTPKPSSETYLKMMQDTMLNTMEELMPQNFDFGQLAKLFERQNQNQNVASLTFKLTQFFSRVISQNFISLQSYFGLEQQTQKLQSTIRGHIKMEQQMKMYLQHLEYKIERYEYHLKKLRKHHQNLESSHQLKQFKERDSLQHLKKRQTQLLKERLILLRKVDHLQRRLKDQQVQLKRLNSPTSATIQQIKEGLNRDREISEGKAQGSYVMNSTIEITKPLNQMDRRMSTNSFGSDHQITQKKSSIPINAAQSYRIYSLTGKDSTQISNNFVSIQHTEIKKPIPVQQTKKQDYDRQKDEAEGDQQYEDLNSPIEHLIKVQ